MKYRHGTSILSCFILLLSQLIIVKPSILCLIVAVFVLLAPLTSAETGDDDDDRHETAAAAMLSGQSVVFLEQDTQALAGVETITLQPAHFQSEQIAYGKAVNLQPLLELRQRYFNAAAEHSIAKSRFDQADQAIKRLRNLHKNQAVSTRKLQQQHSLWLSAKAEYEASGLQLKSIRESSLLDWGKQLSDWALTPESQQFTDMISGEKTLLQITLPPDQSLPDTTQSIYTARSGQRRMAQKATLISADPQTDETLQGEAFFFLSDDKLSSGMRVTAWIPQQQSSLAGVIIPASAVIRHLGQSYVYLKTDKEQFTRRKLSNLIDAETGYFIRDELAPGLQLVTTGAQVLLSEEFRGRIPDEDDDD